MHLTSGAKLGPYEIRSLLGAGGMGEVYRARDTKLGREVALKVLPEALAKNAERMARFQREAQVLASLNHPNIASIYGLEDSGGLRALVMELVEGPTLADRLKQAAIPLEEALPIARQIAEALESAHDKNIIHRDLKPANVKVTPEGTAKVLDFGLAKAAAEPVAPGDPSNSPTLTAAATVAGIIMGTAAYMAPEQARGHVVDKRADVWSFGAVLFEMLTGQRAFPGETTSDTLAGVLKVEPDWNALPASTPPSIVRLLRRCLTKDRKQRLQAIGEARIAIEEALSGGGDRALVLPSAQPASADLKGSATSWRRTLPWAFAGLLVGALLSGFAVWKLFSTASRLAPMRFSAVTNFAGVQTQPALSSDGRSVAFVSNRDGRYDIYVGLINGGSLVRVTNDPNLKARPRWSPDGTMIAYGRLNDSGLWDAWEVPALGGTPRPLALNAKDPSWSPDGHSFAYEYGVTGAIWISDLSGQNARQVTRSELSGVEKDTEPSFSPNDVDTEPSFSPNGRELAFVNRLGGPYGELWLVDLDSGKARRLTHDNALALSPVWAPDSGSIYFASSRGGAMNIWKIAAAGGKPEQITAGQGDDAQLDVSADGKRIVFSTFRENINIMQTTLGTNPGQQNPKPLTADPARNQIAPVYSRDGRHLAYFCNRKGVEKESIWVANADGSDPMQLVQDGRVNIFPRWASDGEHLVYRSQAPSRDPSTVEYRNVSISGGAPRTLSRNAGSRNMLDLNFDVGPDGRLLFTGSGGRIETYDPSENKTQVLATPPANEKWWLLRWLPEGHSIAYIVNASQEKDSRAGLWVDDFKSPPRQIFRGWVIWYACGRKDEVYILEGKPDLNGVLWRVGWNGQGLTRTSTTIPLVYTYWILLPRNSQEYFDVSPDGRYLAYNAQGVLQANIGMIENAP